MLKGRIKHFFWMSVALGVLAIGGNLSHVQMPWNSPGHAGNASPVAVNDVKAMYESSRASGQPVVSETGKLMVWKNKTYVRIENDWFEQRADNIYNVKGVKTLYVDGPSQGTLRIPASAKVVVQDAADSAEERSTALLKKLSTNPFSAYSPDQVGDAMKALQEAKAQNAERNKILKEMAR